MTAGLVSRKYFAAFQKLSLPDPFHLLPQAIPIQWHTKLHFVFVGVDVAFTCFDGLFLISVSQLQLGKDHAVDRATLFELFFSFFRLSLAKVLVTGNRCQCLFTCCSDFSIPTSLGVVFRLVDSSFCLPLFSSRLLPVLRWLSFQQPPRALVRSCRL